MIEYCLILPEKPSPFLNKMIDNTLEGIPYIIVEPHGELPDLRNKRIIFAIELPITGESSNLNNIFQKLFLRGNDALYGSSAIVLIHSNYQLFTKTAAQSIIFKANLLGCRFVGRPMVEATGNLDNLIPLKKVYNMDLEEICLYQCRELGERFVNDKVSYIKNPKLLALHSSNRATSNTLTLWDMVKSNLDMEIQEINIGNGNIVDCKGCPYKTCKYFGSEMKCFYGGIVVEEVYPAILESDILVFICPNYNDMLGANIVALINRLTALYRKTKFFNKSIFSIIVSGHSGGDALAKQLISSLNINKTFRLPPYFSLMATANDKGAILNIPNIEKEAKDFAIKITTLSRARP
ncbi:MAG: NAD(P)H-dependent oxidoreductase [Tissierellia bacterium]|nr:NAD(P)H-dependent oxidoreductase [Tissierellia bacterium]